MEFVTLPGFQCYVCATKKMKKIWSEFPSTQILYDSMNDKRFSSPSGPYRHLPGPCRLLILQSADLGSLQCYFFLCLVCLNNLVKKIVLALHPLHWWGDWGIKNWRDLFEISGSLCMTWRQSPHRLISSPLKKTRDPRWDPNLERGPLQVWVPCSQVLLNHPLSSSYRCCWEARFLSPMSSAPPALISSFMRVTGHTF